MMTGPSGGMADRSRVAFFAAVIAVVVALAGLTYIWLSAQRPGEGRPGNASVALTAVRTGLAFPIAIAFAGDGRVFYAERGTGNIQILGNATTNTTTFYTLSGTDSSGERGLLGLALDPDFPTTPYVYAYQTYDDTGNGTIYNRIVRIVANGNAGVSHAVVLRMPPLSGATNHNGGAIAFGPDRKLYAVVGENANPSLSQDPMSPMGKVLRMNPDGSAPIDNPFYGNPNWNNLTYTYGHRNMFGLAFHPTNGRAYVTENGPQDSDEINLLTAGGNYGWPAVRGIAHSPPYIDPIIAYTPVIVPTNAAFYTASVPAGSLHHLVFGSFSDRRLRELTLSSDGASVVNESILATAGEGILDVEMGLDGHLWVTTPSAIYRLVAQPIPMPSMPAFAAPIGGYALARIRVSTFGEDRSFPCDCRRNAHHPGNLSRDRGVSAARCRRTESRATLASRMRSHGS